ncbi:hypothetical protein C8T65DRAFT_744116 [Cerioporus squamosus]|nr:hypothetical protein C8T65DRAFT_744116 [Cerioporus squamosus]
MPPEGLLLLVETPTASTHDVSQLRSLGLASRARHSRFAGLQYDPAPTSGTPTSVSKSYVSSNGDCGLQRDTAAPTVSPNTKPIANVQGRINNRLPVVRSNDYNAELTAPSTIHAGRSYKRGTPLSGKDTSWVAHAPRMVSAGCRTQVTPEQILHFQGELEDIDNASLKQSNLQHEVYPSADGHMFHELWYTVNLVMDSDEWDLAPKKGKEYKLAVDTGDGCFWFFEKSFQQLQSVRLSREETLATGSTHKYVTKDWSDLPLDLQQRCRRRRVIPPSAAPIAEVCMLRYADGGELRVKRWHSSPGVDLQFRAPVWNWILGASEHSSNHKLRFSRILADAVNSTNAAQGIDGNLGMGVPGWRQPWSFAGSKDRATFFDVLNHGAGLVPKPMCVTVRLLPPDEYELARANHRVQSFLYYGIGTPCGFLGIFDKIVIPEFTPRLYIFPDLRRPDLFRWWTMQLLSITLLEPLVQVPNYASLDPRQWYPKHIPVGDISAETGSPTGIRVIYDSGATCSVLPQAVLQAIWTQWFSNDAQSYPDRPTFLRHNRDFSMHDVLFEFQDSIGQIVTLRCSAREFLSSPWVPNDGFPGTLACFSEPRHNEGPYVLGANFFWTSIVRMNGTHRGERPIPGQTTPYMQFAPQRILGDGFKLAGPWELEIHADLPPDMQAVLRDQPELQA